MFHPNCAYVDTGPNLATLTVMRRLEFEACQVNVMAIEGGNT